MDEADAMTNDAQFALRRGEIYVIMWILLLQRTWEQNIKTNYATSERLTVWYVCTNSDWDIRSEY